MLNNEEKETIEWLKRLVKINKRDNLDDTFAEILLNLIEKQDKEIELLSKKLYLCTPEIPQHEHQQYVSYVDLVDKIMKQEKIIDNAINEVEIIEEQEEIDIQELKEYEFPGYVDIKLSPIEKKLLELINQNRQAVKQLDKKINDK